MKLLQGIIFASLFMFLTAAVGGPAPSDPATPKVQPVRPSVQKPVAPKPPPRETRLRVSGVVRELEGPKLRIERNITAESMEFILERPVTNVAVGDRVVISYIIKEGQNIAKRVRKESPTPKQVKTAPASPAVPAPAPRR